MRRALPALEPLAPPAGVLAVTAAASVSHWLDGPAHRGPVAAPWEGGLLALAFLLVGLPHGALDAWTAAKLWRLDTAGRMGGFLAAYVALALAFVALWLAAPSVAVAGFLGVAVHHFGQGDLHGWTAPVTARVVVGLTRGAVVVLVPLWVQPDATGPILAAMLSQPAEPVIAALDAARWLGGAFVGLHLTAVAAVLALAPGNATWRALAAAAVLGVSLLLARPLVGFLTYFCFWHSRAYLLALDRLRRGAARPTAAAADGEASVWPRSLWWWRVPSAWPTVAGGVIAIAAVVALGLAVEASTETWSRGLGYAFVGIGALTMPHLVIVETLARAGAAAGAPAGGWPSVGVQSEG